MRTSSAILNADSYFARTYFDSSSIFASSVSGTRKSHGGPDLGNTVASAIILCCFWPIFVLPQIQAFLANCFAQIARNVQVIFLIDRSIRSILKI